MWNWRKLLLSRLDIVIAEQRETNRLLRNIERILTNRYSVKIEEKLPMNMKLVAGTGEELNAQLLDNGKPIAIPSGSTWEWASPDALVTFTPAKDGNPNNIEVNVAGSDTQTSAAVTASITAPDGSKVQGEIKIPVTPEPHVFTVVITEMVSTTTMVTAPATATAGADLKLSATVSGGSTEPTGTVEFLDGTTALGTEALDSTGVAALDVPGGLPAGTHSITAAYQGDDGHEASTSAAATVVVS